MTVERGRVGTTVPYSESCSTWGAAGTVVFLRFLLPRLWPPPPAYDERVYRDTCDHVVRG